MARRAGWLVETVDAAPPATLDQAAGDYLEQARRSCRAATVTQYRYALRVILDAFGPCALEQVTPARVYRLHLALRDTPFMANRIISVLTQLMSHCVRAGWIPRNPCADIGRYPEPPRGRYLTDAELAAIRAESPPALRLIIDLCYLTGQRIGDVLLIKQTDITRDTIEFQQQKTGKRLAVARTPALDSVITAARTIGGPWSRVYLVGLPQGRPRNYRAVRDMWMRTCRRAGVIDARLHDLRAKSLTDAKARGLDPQALAGHSTPAQTARYLRNHSTPTVNGPE